MSWGELIGVWRYIDYKFNDLSNASLKMNGPAIRVAFPGRLDISIECLSSRGRTFQGESQ
jgi:hypothetical protein